MTGGQGLAEQEVQRGQEAQEEEGQEVTAEGREATEEGQGAQKEGQEAQGGGQCTLTGDQVAPGRGQ